MDTICVIDWSFLPDHVIVEAEGFNNSCANIADDILEYTKKEIEANGILCGEIFKQCGSAVESIIEQSAKEKYDLILLGSHGKKGIQKWLGSVSREIAYSEGLSLPTFRKKKTAAKKFYLQQTEQTVLIWQSQEHWQNLILRIKKYIYVQ